MAKIRRFWAYLMALVRHTYTLAAAFGGAFFFSLPSYAKPLLPTEVATFIDSLTSAFFEPGTYALFVKAFLVGGIFYAGFQTWNKERDEVERLTGEAPSSQLQNEVARLRNELGRIADRYWSELGESDVAELGIALAGLGSSSVTICAHTSPDCSILAESVAQAFKRGTWQVRLVRGGWANASGTDVRVSGRDPMLAAGIGTALRPYVRGVVKTDGEIAQQGNVKEEIFLIVNPKSPPSSEEWERPAAAESSDTGGEDTIDALLKTLTPEAQELLRSAAFQGGFAVRDTYCGFAVMIPSGFGPPWTTNQNIFAKESNPETALRYRDALDELEQAGLVEPHGDTDKSRIRRDGYSKSLTTRGWLVVKRLADRELADFKDRYRELGDEEVRLLRLVYAQRGYGADKVRFSHDGKHLIRIRGGDHQPEPTDIDPFSSIFGRPHQGRVDEAQFTNLVENMPPEFLRLIPGTVYGNPYTVKIMPPGIRYYRAAVILKRAPENPA